MLRFASCILLLCGVSLMSADVAFAGPSVNASFTSEPEGVDVVVRKKKSRKVVGRCVTPCDLKLKTKRDFTVSFRKTEHSSLYTNKSNGVEQDGVLTFHAKLKSMASIREADRLKKAECDAKKLKPKGGETDRNAKPLVKMSIKHPNEAVGNGFCKLRFDVNTEGRAENIDVLECSDPILEKLSTVILPKWKYMNNMSDGCPIPKSGVETTVEFN